MEIEVKRFKDPSGREGSYAPMGNGLIKLLFDDGEMVILRSCEAAGKDGGRSCCRQEPIQGADTGGSTQEKTLIPMEWEENYRKNGGFPITSITEIPSLLEHVCKGEGFPLFTVLMFVPKDSVDGEPVNLQYSMEDGTLGLDWVLLGKRNIEDRDAIIAFAQHRGYELLEHEMNKVNYLRTVGTGLATLGMQILCEFYELSQTAEVQVLVQGFKWPGEGCQHALPWEDGPSI